LRRYTLGPPHPLPPMWTPLLPPPTPLPRASIPGLKNNPQFVHGSLDKLGIIFVAHEKGWTSAAQGVTEQQGRKCDNGRVYGREARLCTLLLASYKSSPKCPRILGQTAHKSSPKCPRRRAPAQPGCEGLATFVVNTPWIGFLSKDPWTIGTLHARPPPPIWTPPAPLGGPPHLCGPLPAPYVDPSHPPTPTHLYLSSPTSHLILTVTLRLPQSYSNSISEHGR